MERNVIPESKLAFSQKPSMNLEFRRQKEVNLVSNYLKIAFRPNEAFVRQYSIKFEPEIAIDSEYLRKCIYRGIFEELKAAFYPFVISGESLFSTKLIDEKLAIRYTFTKDEQVFEYQITIERTSNEIDLSNIRSINSFSTKVKNFIEIVIKNILNANQGMVRFNKKNIFDYNSAIQLQDSEKAFLMPGYSTNVSITETGIYLRVGLKNKFINGKTCYEKMEELMGKYKNGEFLRAVTDFFKNRQIMATYGTHRVYRVDAISFDLNVLNKTITQKEKGNNLFSEITLQQYYRDQHQKEIQNLTQPLLINYNKNHEPVYLIPELCFLTGMDDSMKESEPLKKNMISRTKVTPKDRMDRIYYIKNLIYKKNSRKRTRINRVTKQEIEIPGPNDVREQWGLNIGDFKELKGRLLEPPALKFSNDIHTPQGGRIKGTNRLLEPVDLDSHSWAVVCTKQNSSIAEQMIKLMQNASENLGVRIERPRKFLTHHGRHGEEWVEFLENQDFNGIRIILFILDRTSQQYYGGIKRYIYTEIGIPTQVVRKENQSKNLSYYSNVVNQMMAKTGAKLYSIHLDDQLAKFPGMIIGYDCVKFGKGKRKFVMTASYDQNYSKFYTDEIVTDFDSEVGPIGTLMRRCLDYFTTIYNQKVFPFYIFIYRSGVSEKEKEVLLQNEVKTLIGLFSGNLEQECYRSGYTAKFCYTVVNKRTEAKFFEYSNGNVNNPKEGTVIDTQLTTPGYYEFYMQPQFVNSGTATPTHFHCIYDNTEIPIEILENITYKMCYYYWNWSGAIRVPACLKFAEVANKFGSSYLKEGVNDNIKNLPYYI